MPDPKRDVERLIEDGLIRYGGGDLAGALAASIADKLSTRSAG